MINLDGQQARDTSTAAGNTGTCERVTGTGVCL